VALARAEEMNRTLINNWNGRVKHGDTVYVLGDMICKGAEKGILGLNIGVEELFEELLGTIVIITGNHDSNNGMPRGLDRAVLSAGGMQLLMLHNPAHAGPDDARYGAILNGHVHTAWAEQAFCYNLRIPCINVGVDVRRYAPMKLDEVVGTITRWKSRNPYNTLVPTKPETHHVNPNPGRTRPTRYSELYASQHRKASPDPETTGQEGDGAPRAP
jgi:calcineurin-like phosphoesterase family protein